MLSSVAVAVTPSNIFNSDVDAVTPSKIFNSFVVTVAPSNIDNCVVDTPLTVPVVAIFCEPKSGDILVPAIAADAFTSSFTIVPSFIIVDVTVPVSPVVMTVPVVSGNVIVLSDVGLATVNVVSWSSSAEPSKVKFTF